MNVHIIFSYIYIGNKNLDKVNITEDPIKTKLYEEVKNNFYVFIR